MVSLPSGTVGFLSTDLEGSTAPLEHHRDQMRATLARSAHWAHASATAQLHVPKRFATVLRDTTRFGHLP